MADFYVKNSLNPYKAVRFGLSFQQLIDKNSKDGEHIWVVEIGTTALDKDGNKLLPVYINAVTEPDLNKAIDRAVADLASKIDWDPLEEDREAPFVYSTQPSQYNASITDRVKVHLKDLHPSYGIDLSSVQLLINGIDVTNEVSFKGNVYDLYLDWAPPIIVYEQEKVV